MIQNWLPQKLQNYIQRTVILLCLCLLCFSSLSIANAQDATSKNRRTVRVGYYIAAGFQDYDPWTGVYSGSGYEYLMALKQYSNWNIVFVPVEFSSGVNMLENGELDLMNNVSKTPEREKTLSFSKYPSGENYGTLSVDINNTRYAYNDYASFSNMRIGLKQDSVFRSTFEDFCRKHEIKPQIINYYNSTRELNKAYSHGDIDTRLVSSSYHDPNIRAVTKFAPMEYYFAVPKENSELLKELDDAMEDVRTYLPELSQQLEKKYSKGYAEKNVVLSAREQWYVQEYGTVTVAVSNDWAPVAYYDETKGYQGVLANIYKRLSKETGLNFKFVFFNTYEEGLRAAANGEVDMVAHCPYDFVFADRWHLQLTDKLQDVNVYRVINGNASDGAINTVGVYGNDYMDEILHKYYGDKVKFVPYNNLEEAVNGVLTQAVDCTYVNQYAATSYQNNGKYLPLRYILVSPMQYSFSMGISDQKDVLLKSIISKALGTVSDEYIDNLFQQEELANRREDFTTQMHRNPGSVMLIFGIILASVLTALGFGFYSKRMSRKNMELEDARMAQTDFLSRMSHDMRTPMNGIIGLSYLMEKEKSLDTLKGYIPQLQESSKYLLQLINDVLDVNKISSGHMELNPHVCDEKVIFDSIVEMMEPQMQAKNIKFNFIRHNIDWKCMKLDEQRVKQIFMNLLNNAVKFTPSGGEIDLVMELVSETDTNIRDKFVVRDTGIGISEQFLPHVFEAFQQEHNDNTAYSNGTGLGLSIVKKLVELMDGTIEVTSQVGKGTEFTMYLNFPLATQEEEMALHREKPDAGAIYTKVSNLNILLCEDHPLNATIARKLLEKEGNSVVWAKNGAEGVEKFKQSYKGSFDVVLMDIRMPVMDGLECTKAIRSLDRADAKVVPIIAMSANAYQEDVEKSLAAGMNAHLSKPIDSNILYEEISKYVKK